MSCSRVIVHATLVLTMVACVQPYEDRAERDELVGHAYAGGVDFHVAGGLAAVQLAVAGELVLWASAPELELVTDASMEAATEWILEVHNVMPGSLLSCGSAAADSGETPWLGMLTRKRWRVSLEPGTRQRCRVAVPEGGEQPWRFAVLSDIQGAVDEVGAFWSIIDGDPLIRFIISAGDLTPNGTPEQLSRLKDELSTRSVPFYTTLGNHELDFGGDAQAYRDAFGRGSYHFGYRGARFTMLDAASATLDPMVSAWLDEWLAGAGRDLHIVVAHVPAVDPVGVRNCSFASRNEGYKLLAQLAQGNVDLMLHGHIHSYHLYENAGITAIISGGGGGRPEKWDRIGRHFVAVDVDSGRGEVVGTQMVRVD